MEPSRSKARAPRDCSSAEKSLMSHAKQGNLLTLGDGLLPTPNGQIHPDEWKERTVRAEVLVFLLRGGDRSNCVHARGVVLKGAYIDNDLDLSHERHISRLQLENCYLHKLNLSSATIEELILQNCEFNEISLKEANVNGRVILSHSKCKNGSVCLTGARISKCLDCTRIVFERKISNNDDSDDDAMQVFDAQRATIGGDVLFSRSQVMVTGEALTTRDAYSSDVKCVTLGGSKIGGRLDCRHAEFCTPFGFGLDVGGADIKQDFLFSKGKASKATLELAGAKIGGQLDCTAAELMWATEFSHGGGADRSPGSSHAGGGVQALALNAQGADIGEDVTLNQLRASTVLLSYARIGGKLSCAEMVVSNYIDLALDVFCASIQQDVILKDISAPPHAMVRLSRAKVAGQLTCDGTKGLAINAEAVEVMQDVVISHARASVTLAGAKIGGQLICSGARFYSETCPAPDVTGGHIERGVVLVGWGTGSLGAGSAAAHAAGTGGTAQGFALNAKGTEIGQDVTLCNFTAGGLVTLAYAKIGGKLRCTNVDMVKGGLALDAFCASIQQEVILRDIHAAEVRLSRAKVKGGLICEGCVHADAQELVINAEAAEILQDVVISKEHAAVLLQGATIGGQLNCRSARFCSTKDRALDARGAHIHCSVVLCDIHACTAVNLAGAKIGGQLSCNGAQIMITGPGAATDEISSRDGFKGCWVSKSHAECDDVQTGPRWQGADGRGQTILPGMGTHGGTRRVIQNDEVAAAGPARVHEEHDQVSGGVSAEQNKQALGDQPLALSAHSIEVGGDVMFCKGKKDFAADGSVSLEHAKIGGQLICSDASFRGSKGALDVNCATIQQDVRLTRVSSTLVRLSGVRINGHIHFIGGKVSNHPSLVAEGAEVVHDVIIKKECSSVSLTGSKVGGHLYCRDAGFSSTGQLSLNARGCEIGRDVVLYGVKAKAGVLLDHASVGGRVDCTNSTISMGDSCTDRDGGPQGPGYMHQVDDPVFEVVVQTSNPGPIEDPGHKCIGKDSKAIAAMSIAFAKISGELLCKDAKFTGSGGWALDAQSAHVGRDLVLKSCRSTGGVRLANARINGHLNCCNAHFTGELDFQDMLVERTFLWKEVTHEEGVKVKLGRAHVRNLDDDVGKWPADLDLDGFTYMTLGGSSNHGHSVQPRLQWLQKNSSQEPSLQDKHWFQPQPYQQLAKVLGEAGNRQHRGTVLLAMENQLRRSQRQMLCRFWIPCIFVYDNLLRWIVGHGYRPERAFYLATLIILITIMLANRAWEKGGMAPTAAAVLVSKEWQAFYPNDTSYLSDNGCRCNDSSESLAKSFQSPAKFWANSTGRDYETFNPVAYAIDVFVPIINLGQEQAWAPTTAWSSDGKILFYFLHGVRVLGWMISGIGAAALAGFIRND